MSLNQFLHQPRTPVFTGISLFTTAGVEIAILWIASLIPGSGTNGLGGFILGAALLLAGGVINAIAGVVAHSRGGLWGGRIAALGATAWFVTVAAAPFFW